MKYPSSISVKRCHGIGNVVMLLPVLDRIVETGCGVELVTRTEWVETLSALRPTYILASVQNKETIDLDALTRDAIPSRHRTQEFGELLGVTSRLSAPKLVPPKPWVEKFSKYRSMSTVVFAPEVGHPARNWSLEKIHGICTLLTESNHLVLVGKNERPALPCREDLRGTLDLKGLIGFLSNARMVITMDSGCLHLANALGITTVSIFGGIDPRYRIHGTAKSVAIQAAVDCSPCNKLELCNGNYSCLETIRPRHVLEAMEIALRTSKLVILKV